MSENKKIVLNSQAKQIAINVVKHCFDEAKQKCLINPISCPLERASAMTGVPRRTLSRLKSFGIETKQADRKQRSDKFFIDDFDICVIRRTIINMYLNKRVLPTINAIHSEIINKIDFKGGKTILRKLLKEMGFNWKKCSTNRKILMEKPDIVSKRINYLREIKKLRETGHNIIYMDETYINSSHTVPKCWQLDGNGLSVPIGAGDRLIVVDAGSEKGFVPNASLIYKAKSSTGDYHHEMNAENFTEWLREKLIPNLEPNSVLVVDNASYHNVQEDKKPTTSWKKKDIQEWLTKHNIKFTEDMVRAQLLTICKQQIIPPSYRIDYILREHGHKILRLPPYHADLNPIELIWADLKSYVASQNLKFKLSDVQQLAEKQLKDISTEKWKRCVEHVKKIETDYWKNDIAVDEEIEKFVINLDDTDSSDEDTDTATEEEEDEEEETSTVTADEESTISEEDTTDTADEIFTVTNLHGAAQL